VFGLPRSLAPSAACNPSFKSGVSIWFVEWYTHAMNTTIDKGGRVVIPASIRERLGLKPGTELEIEVEDFSLRLSRKSAAPRLVRSGNRWVARPAADASSLPDVDLAKLIEEERNRWP
jgi:AbrB family looped-hinge helix DNA binding protein